MNRIATLFMVITILSFMRPDITCADIYARADMSYQKTTTSSAGQTTESSSLNQGYSLGLSHALTSTITISGDVRLTINRTNGQQREDIFPVFYLNYAPPSLYYLSLSYNSTVTSPPGGAQILTSYTNASFSLPLERWPSVSLTYNRSTTLDFLEEVHKTDTVSTNKSANASYNITFLETAASLNYSFSNPTTEDRVTNVASETQSHLASADFSRSFMDNKVKTSVNVGYNLSKTTQESLAGPTQFEQERTPPAQGLFAVDTTPTLDSLSSTPALIDNDTGTLVAGIDLSAPPAFNNIGISFSAAQSVFKIHLSIRTSDTNIATYVNTNQFGWQLYTSSDGTTWTVQSTPTVSYDSVNSLIEFTFTETSNLFFKVVNTAAPPGALPINVTEIQAIGFINLTPAQEITSTTTRNFGGFNISFTPLERLSMGYSISYDHSTQDPSNLDSTGINQGANINFIAVPQYLTVTASYTTSTTRTDQEATPGVTTSTESGTDGYALSLSSSPLPTINVGLSYNYNESLTGGETISKNDSFSGSLFMNLYKGIDLGLNSSFSESKNLQADSKTEGVTHTANLNLVPWRILTIIVNGSTSSNTTDTAGVETSSTTSQSLNTTFTFTPTRKLYASAAITIEPTTSQSYTITWLPTGNTQASVRYGIAGDVSNSGADVSWTPFSRLSLRIGYSGTRTDNATHDHSDSIFASASLNL